MCITFMVLLGLCDYFITLFFLASNFHFNYLQDIPSKGMKIIYIDKTGTPHLRIRAIDWKGYSSSTHIVWINIHNALKSNMD